MSIDMPIGGSAARSEGGAPVSASSMVDIHCHCLPGLDDGPADIEAAIALCRQMVADGTSIAIATPHQLGSYERRNSAAEVRLAIPKLNEALAEKQIPLQVLPGAEVRLDGRLIQLLQQDAILTLADQHRYLLLELPPEPLIDLQPVIKLLSARNITVILAHPERQRGLRPRFDLLRKWAEMGAAFQINAASVVGMSSQEDSQMAWKMAEAGLVDFVASDCHSATRRPSLLSKAREMLTSRLGYAAVRRICVDNPALLISGQSIATWRSLPASRANG